MGNKPATEFQKAILTLSDRLFAAHGYHLKLAFELEWLFLQDEAVDDALWHALTNEAREAGFPLESIGREPTHRADLQQYECRFRAMPPMLAVQALEWLRQRWQALCEQAGIVVHREPFHAASGLANGLHWHLHLVNADEVLVFLKQEDEMSAPLAHTLGGLLETMPALMACFAPSRASRVRLQSAADHVPTRICWGGNNRTAALRMPESVIPMRHIEHRVCGSDAPADASVWAILLGVIHGLESGCDPGEQLYGDARRSGEVYPLIPSSDEAIAEAAQDAAWLARFDGAAELLATLQHRLG